MAKTSRPWKRVAMKLVGSGLFLAVLFLFLPLSELGAALRHVPLGVGVLAVFVYLGLHFSGAMKWRLTVNLTGAGLDVRTAAQCYYAGLFGNTFLPSIVGGDVVRAGLALGKTRARTGLILGALVDRLLDFIALLLIALTGLVLVPGHVDGRSTNVLLYVGLGLALVVMAGVGGVLCLPLLRMPYKHRRKLVRLRQAVRSIAQHPRRVLASLGIGIALQSSLVLLNAWLGAFCGLECPLAVWFFVWPLAKLSAALPVTQGGLGVREVALAALFLPFGVPATLAVAAGLVFEAVVFSGGLLSGPLAFFLGRIRAKRDLAVAYP